MAAAPAAVASKGPAMASLLKKMLAEPASSGAPVAYYALRPASVTAARRLFNTQCSEVRCYDDDGDDTSESEREHEDADAGDRRRARDSAVSSFFSQGTRCPSSSPFLFALCGKSSRVLIIFFCRS